MRTVRTIRVLSVVSLVALIIGAMLLVVAMAGLIVSLLGIGARCVGQHGCSSPLTGLAAMFALALIVGSVLVALAVLVFLPVHLVCLVKAAQRGEWEWLAALGLPPLLGMAALIWGGSVVHDAGVRSLVFSGAMVMALILALLYSRRLQVVAPAVSMR